MRHTLSYRWTQFFIACLVFDVIGMVWPVLRVLVVSGIVRCYPIIYFSPKARNATLNYMRALPSVLQWIGAWRQLLHLPLTKSHTLTHSPRTKPHQIKPTASEFFLVTVYACACVLLYSNIDRDGRSGQTAFLDFSQAFISLYSLSLTVNNPDIYLVRGGLLWPAFLHSFRPQRHVDF